MNEFPSFQAIPIQGESISFRIRETEVIRYNSGRNMYRPCLFPVLGPSGRCVTRMGHPHDPLGHRHHYSVWMAHHAVNAVDFWSDQPEAGKQVHRNILALEDGAASAAARLSIQWAGANGEPILQEERTYRLTDLPDNERLIDVHLALTPAGGPVTFGATSFGLLAVRVAKTMCVADGGGQILNSVGALGEERIFWKPAEWCDYSGPVTADEWNGITFFSHPTNHDHPPDWHVRSDGWMGACLSREEELRLAPEETLELRYGLYVHHGSPNEVDVIGVHADFAGSPFRPCEK